ncbi:MAG: methyltransferase [Myxococcaceae bacterium]|nr:methyltransferase [Myxococcaceae bacterium]
MKFLPKLLVPLALAACASSNANRAGTAPGTTAPGVSNAPVAFGSLDAALAGAHRPAADSARDQYRHPRETLTFFGVHPGQTVIELSPGGGWYTAILAPLLHDSGSLSCAVPAATGPRAQYHARFRTFLATRPDLYGNVRVSTLEPPATIELGPDASADVVLTFRNLHGWINDHAAEQVFAAVFRVLKPGGVFGIEEHRANPGADPATSSRNGYVPEAHVIALATAAGLVLDERSEINANPRDTKDYPEGVWSLPPTLRQGETDRARYLAIGESDRMTLRFRRPPAAH